MGNIIWPSRFGAAAVTDPDWANVVFLAGFNGADGATTYTEESQYAASATFLGNAQLDTAIKMFGSAALLLDGTGDTVTFPNRSEYRLVPTASAPFTIDFWFYPLDEIAPGTARIFLGQTTAGQISWYIFQAATTGTLGFSYTTNGSTQIVTNLATLAQYQGAVTPNAWNSARLAYNGGNLAFYINGNRFGNAPIAIPAVFASSAPLSIGGSATATSPFPGSIDEVRITRGVARSTGSTYTVDVTEFPRS